MSISCAAVWAVPATGYSAPSCQRSWWPIREQRQSLPHIIFNSCHFWIFEVRSCLLVVNSQSLKSVPTNLYALWLLSCLMPFFSRSSETPVVQAWLCSLWIILPLCAPAVMLMQSEQAHHSPNITAEPIITVKNVLSAAAPHRDRVRKCFTLISQCLENPLQ